MFITLEGIEGAGKTTQIKKLAHYYNSKDEETIITREPGGTPLGKRFRELILDANTQFQSNYTELFLFFADRCEHLETIIKPALAGGKVVLCDRFMDSTIAYQVGGRGIPESEIQGFLNVIDPFPDLTLLLDLPPEEGLKRAKSRAELDRFEREDIDFHNRVRQTFLCLADRNPQRIKVIDASQNPDDVFKDIQVQVESYVLST